MKDIKQIYRDHTGRWREQNPYSTCRGNTHSNSCVCGEWALFEDSIQYHEFPNCPDTKPSEVVMAYLQTEYYIYGLVNNYWTTDKTNYKGKGERQIWVAANQSNQEGFNPQFSSSNPTRGDQEGKEEQAPIIQRLNKIEEVLSETVKLVNELAIAVRKRFENERR